jgi:hypothetical protein
MADLDVKKYQEQFESLQKNLPKTASFKFTPLPDAGNALAVTAILVALILFGTLGGLTYWALH